MTSSPTPTLGGKKDCERERCMPCDTKERTGRNKTRDCSRRSVVYETWCLKCEEMTKELIDRMENKTDKEKKELKKNITLYKYVGESWRELPLIV